MERQERCAAHDMVREYCADCRGLVGVEEQAVAEDLALLEIRTFFTATMPGTCAVDRDHMIAVGDEIGMVYRRSELGGEVTEKVGWCCPRCADGILAV